MHVLRAWDIGYFTVLVVVHKHLCLIPVAAIFRTRFLSIAPPFMWSYSAMISRITGENQEVTYFDYQPISFLIARHAFLLIVFDWSH